MKKISKIFFAVAALFAFACTTDATQDLAVNPEGQTTLTLSLEESRTQLGEKADGLYPVTWSDGDAISVNGVKSSRIEISDDATTAKFYFDGVLSYPYAIAYPAAEKGKVVFADVQQQVYGTFTNGAAVMYGYAESAGAASLSHLTGTLRIGVTGSTAITRVQISTSDHKPISGEFELDFATGKLKPTANSKYTIECTFQESADGDAGLALSSTPYYFHFTVPAGEYNELYVTLFDGDNSLMCATVKAGDTKPLVAGKVREFSNTVAYQSNSNYFIIKDKTSLMEFASTASSLDKDAIVIEDIDMTGESWTPIEGFSCRFLGNGHTIKGLNAPFFGTTSATIKGLHLVDVDIEQTITKAQSIGALVCTYNGPSISLCSASGSLSIVGNIADETSANSPFAGLIGSASSEVTLSHLVNKVNATVTGTFSGTYGTVHLGGIIGSYSATVTLDNLVNEGALSIGDATLAASNIGHNANFGGILGYYSGETTAKDLVNKGKLTFVNTTVADNINVGGIMAYPAATTTVVGAWTNGGEIEVKDATVSKEYARIGGIVGMLRCVTTGGDSDSWTNNGTITISNINAKNSLLVSGVLAHAYKTTTISNLTNNGAISLSETSTSGAIYLAGTLAYTEAVVTASKLTNNGAITFTNVTSGGNLNCGGVVGLTSAKCVFSTLHNKGALTFTNITTTANYCNIGGIMCYNSTAGTSLTDLTNEGAITVAGATSKNYLDVGGVMGTITKNTTINGNIENKGNVTVNATVTSTKDIIRGVAGIIGSYHTAALTMTDATLRNSGVINVSGEFSTIGVGGVFGAYNSNNAANAINTGKVICTAKATTAFVGGLIGGASGVTNNNLSNSKCYCDVVAYYWDGTKDGAVTKHENVGIATGLAYDAAMGNVTNTQVGGRIFKSGSVVADADGNLSVQEEYTDLADANFFNYIYGSGNSADTVGSCTYWNGVE